MCDFVVRNASSEELDVAIRLGVSILPEWHVSPLEFSCAYAFDPTAVFLGELNNDVIALLCAFKHPGHSTFLSVFLVKEEHRGKGYGRKIWDTVWESIDKSCTICLDAVVDMVPKYRSLGFQSVWETTVVSVDLEKICKTFAKVESPLGVEVKPIGTIEMEELIKYDSSVFGTSRNNFMEKWINIPDSLGWVAVNERGTVIGYTTAIPVISGPDMQLGLWAIRPLYADNDDIAKLLLKTAADAFLSRDDVSVTQFEMIVCGESEYGHRGMQLISGIETTTPPIVIGPRMYTKGVPSGMQPHKVYGITSPAFD